MIGKLSDFSIIKKLGDGAYSSVFKVKKNDDNQFYALKKVNMHILSDKEKENALNEIRILASIDHPNVIGYKDAFIDEATSSLCMIMEYADNGDVFQKICNYQKRETYIKEKKIWYVFIQIVRGLRAIHLRKILHRDMKSANIFLFKDMQAKLGDLNVSKIVKKGLSYTQTGTPYYASPEVWKDMPYDSKSDIWSLGCVLYEMCALVPPFRADDMQGLYKMVIKGKYPRIPDHFSQEMATVIKFMIQISASYRPNCEQILCLPIVDSLSKKFFPEERNRLEEIDEENQALLKTIRNSKNLFSLTERLPKNQYLKRQRSNDVLRRDVSQDSVNIGAKDQQIPQVRFKNNEDSGTSPGKVSRLSRNRSRASDYEEQSPLPIESNQQQIWQQQILQAKAQNEQPQMVNNKPVATRGVSKPKQPRNGQDQVTLPLANLKGRSPSMQKETPKVVRGLTQSPSILNIHAIRDQQSVVEPGQDDEDQPQKPQIDEVIENEGLPYLHQRHRSQAPQISNKKDLKSVAINETESVNSNVPQNKAESPIAQKRNAGPSPPMQLQLIGGQAQRVVNKVRGDKLLVVYANMNNQQQHKVQLLYGDRVNPNNRSPSLPGISSVKRKSNIGAAYQEKQPQGLNRNNSKPQLQLPEIQLQSIARPGVSIDYNSQTKDDHKNQRISSAHKGKSISPQHVVNERSPQPGLHYSPNSKLGKDLTKIPKAIPEWGTLEANAIHPQLVVEKGGSSTQLEQSQKVKKRKEVEEEMEF